MSPRYRINNHAKQEESMRKMISNKQWVDLLVYKLSPFTLHLPHMNKTLRQKRSKSYYYITEDPPFLPKEEPLTTGTKIHLPKTTSKYFFIDFT